MKKSGIVVVFLLLFIISTGLSIYRVKTGDRLEIFNYGYPELTQGVIVGPDGTIQPRLIGSLEVKGKSIEEIAIMIKQQLLKKAPDSQITVILSEPSPDSVFIIGELERPATIDMTYTESMTLLHALSSCGGPTIRADLKNIQIYRKNQSYETVDFSLVFETGIQLNNPILTAGDIVIVPQKSDRRVYIFGNVAQAGALVFEEKEPMMFSILLIKMKFDTKELESSVQFIREGKQETIAIPVDYTSIKDFSLYSNDIFIFKKIDKYVYVTGLEGQGRVEFEKNETLHLQTLFAKLGFSNQNRMTLKMIRPDGTIRSIEVNDENLQNTVLYPGEIVEIPEKNYIFIMEYDKLTGKYEFPFSEPFTLDTLFSYLGINSNDSFTLTLEYPDGQKTTLSYPESRNKGYSLEKATTVIFPNNYIYLSGEISIAEESQSGLYKLPFNKPFTMQTLLQMLGISEKEVFQVQIKLPNGQKFLHSFPESWEKTIPLQAGATVEFPYKRYIYIAGDVSSEQLFFSNREAMNLRNALARLSPVLSANKLEVTVLRGRDQYAFDVESAFLSNIEFLLETGDILLFEKDTENYVLFVSSLQEIRKVYFSPKEDMNLFELLLKSNALSSLSGDEIKTIYPSGRTVISSVKKVLEFEENVDLEPKSVVVISSFDKRIYLIGNATSRGEIVLKPTDDFTLTYIVLKYGGSIGKDTEYILIKDSKGFKYYDPEQVLDVDFHVALEKDCIIYFKPYEARKIYAFGEINNQGIIAFSKSDPLNLLTAIMKCGGFTSSASKKFRIIKPNGAIEYYDFQDKIDFEKIPLEPESYLIADDNRGDYVVVLGDVASPGLEYLTKKENTLLEVLGRKGGVTDWILNTTIQITGIDGKTEIVQIDSDPARLNTVKLKAGDTIFIPPSDRFKVYCFGEVGSPGIVPYRPGLNLLDVVLYSGGPSEFAQMNRVLVFRGGLETDPVIIDFSNYDQRKGIENPEINPGDVVFVPRSAVYNIREVVSYLSSAISLINFGLTVYQLMK